MAFRLRFHLGCVLDDFTLELVFDVTAETHMHGGVVEPIVAQHPLPEIGDDDQMVQSATGGAQIKCYALRRAGAGGAVAREQDCARKFHVYRPRFQRGRRGMPPASEKGPGARAGRRVGIFAAGCYLTRV
jgi:hypothetical protein